MLRHYVPGRLPYWPALTGVAAWSSLLSGVIDGLGVVQSVAIMLFLLYVLSRVTAGWTRRVGVAVAIIVLLRTAEAIAVARTGVTTAGVLGALADGMLDAAVVYMLLRFDPRAAPAYVATVTLLAGVVRASESNTAIAWTAFGLTCATVIAIAAVITRYIARPLPSPGTSTLQRATEAPPTIAPSPRME